MPWFIVVTQLNASPGSVTMKRDTDFITIVSGLPRSGTSMMMRMLDHGGIPPLTDEFRAADDNNPLGYYEFEAVKRLDKDSSWLEDAYDKAVKIIYIFLYQLPPNHRYRVLFMKRNLEEVIASQKVMLRRRNEGTGMTTSRQLMTSFSDQLDKLNLWIRAQPNFSILYLNYDDVVADPAHAALEIKNFLGLDVDTTAMTHSVNPALYRNRSNTA